MVANSADKSDMDNSLSDYQSLDTNEQLIHLSNIDSAFFESHMEWVLGSDRAYTLCLKSKGKASAKKVQGGANVRRPAVIAIAGCVAADPFRFSPEGNHFLNANEPENQKPFWKAKSVCDVGAPSHGDASAWWEKYTSAANLLENAAPGIGHRSHKGFVVGDSLRVGYPLCEPVRPALVDVDQRKAHLDSLKSWPVPPRFRDSVLELGDDYRLRPSPVFDMDKPVKPLEWGTKLPSAEVTVYFTLKYWKIGRADAIFNALVEEVHIIKDAAPLVLEKRKAEDGLPSFSSPKKRQ
ncbi:hypothetical protein BOTBODRAFT_34979, partial [Botryobasidium botryosum FD-172 SS1]